MKIDWTHFATDMRKPVDLQRTTAEVAVIGWNTMLPFYLAYLSLMYNPLWSFLMILPITFQMVVTEREPIPIPESTKK